MNRTESTPAQTGKSEAIARVCHEASRAYCLTLGDTSQLPWDEAPVWQKESVLDGVWAIREGRITRPEQSHINWMEQKRREGWKYGPAKDPAKKEHPNFVPFEQLSADQQAKDVLFFAIVVALM